MLGKERSPNWSRSRSNERQLDLRKYGTTVTDAENQFLENMPDEIKEVLRRHADAQSRGRASQSIADFAGRFLGVCTRTALFFPETFQLLLPRCSLWSCCNTGPVLGVLAHGSISVRAPPRSPLPN